MAEAVVYTRRDCHLCHRAEAILAAIARDYPLTVSTRDVDSDPMLRELYGNRVPVVTLDGSVVAEGRVSEYRLRRSLGTGSKPGQMLGLARAALRRE